MAQDPRNPRLHTLVQFDHPAELLERVGEVFASDEALYSLPLGILNNLLQGHSYGPGTPRFFTVESGGCLELVGIETPPYPLNLVVVEGRDWPALAAVVLEQVHGPKAISSSEAMAQAYSGLRSERSGEQTSVRMRKRLFRLDRVNPPSRPCPGALRPATSADTAQLIDWSYRFYVDIADSRAELGPPTQLSDRVQFFLWEEQGTIRSMAAIARATSRGATLSYVYTPPEWRGRGYAGHLVAALSQHILDSGKEFAALYTDLANPTSNKIYAEVGYRPVADYQVVAFEAGEERKGS